MTTIGRPYHELAETSIVVDVIRMITGALILIMGIRFAAHPHDVLGVIGNSSGFLSFFVVHYIVMCHLVGGVMLMLGFYSRLAAIVQLPILAGAMMLTTHNGLGSIYTSFWFALAVFLMLLVVGYYGSGRFSLDANMRDKKRR